MTIFNEKCISAIQSDWRLVQRRDPGHLVTRNRHLKHCLLIFGRISNRLVGVKTARFGLSHGPINGKSDCQPNLTKSATEFAIWGEKDGPCARGITSQNTHLILTVVCNDNADKQSQTNHVANEHKEMNVDCLGLDNKKKSKFSK